MRSFAPRQKPAHEAKSASFATPSRVLSASYGSLDAGQLQHDFGRVSVDVTRSNDPTAAVHSIADLGLAGSWRPLPHLKSIQQSFGRHDITSVQAYADSHAVQANRQLGALAFTRGNQVAFGETPSLHTVAHEAAHVIQQRGGVFLKDGVGKIDDAYERHADTVADLVVAGQPAGPLLNQMAGASRNDFASQPVQMQPQMKPSGEPFPSLQLAAPDQKTFEEWAVLSAIKQPIADALAHEYVNRRRPVDLAAITTYSHGFSSVPLQEPSEARVSLAIFRSIDIAKTRKGNTAKDWTWKWAEPAQGKPKTPEDKLKETAIWAGKHYVEDKAKEKVEYGVVEGIARPGLNYLRGTKVAALEEGAFAKGLVNSKVKNIAVKWVAKDLLGLSVGVVAAASGVAEIIGFLTLALDVAELLKSLGEPGELREWQQDDARIVAGVKAYLQDKQDAADLAKAVSQPFRAEETRRDATLYVPR